MTMTDPIADMLTRIRNANTAYHEDVVIPYSKQKEEIVKILSEEGYIGSFEITGEKATKVIKIVLKYKDKTRVITGIKKISKPGLKVYAKKNEIPKVLGGLGVSVLSTSKGILSDKNARKNDVGGEVIFYIW